MRTGTKWDAWLAHVTGDRDGLTFFRSAARGLHVPAKLTPEPAEHEARKRRANARPRVGCCEELGGGLLLFQIPVHVIIVAVRHVETCEAGFLELRQQVALPKFVCPNIVKQGEPQSDTLILFARNRHLDV